MNSSTYARRQAFIKHPRPAISEVMMDSAKADFFASVQYLDRRITEVPLAPTKGRES
jgi:hypothetical protein